MNFNYTGVTEAFNELPNKIKELGVTRMSRNGEVIEMPHPIVVTFTDPRDRILLSGSRNANPTFHLIEALWMLAGRNDTQSLTKYVKKMADYSDDGITFHAAYGHRWRRHFKGVDQIPILLHRLKNYENDRRSILAMWDAESDLHPEDSWKDLPCNMLIKFAVKGNSLDMTVFNRSNDVILGMLGANIVHMSILQEYMASRLEKKVGVYHQISDNAHIYKDLLPKLEEPAIPMLKSLELFTAPEEFDAEVEEWFDIKGEEERVETSWKNEILNIASDLAYAHKIGKLDRDTAINYLNQKVEPWRVAAKIWHNEIKERTQ